MSNDPDKRNELDRFYLKVVNESRQHEQPHKIVYNLDYQPDLPFSYEKEAGAA